MKTKSIVILAVSTIGVLFVGAIVSCAGLLYVGFRHMDAEFSPTVDELFAAIDNGGFGETYTTHTSDELQAAVPREQYELLGQTIKARLGTLNSKSLRKFNLQSDTAGAIADIAYDAHFEKGAGTIEARFKKQGERWLLLSIYVDSPALQKDLATAM